MITVFTPTYNRAYIIGRLYESLCRQTCSDFEWLIVDDGSTDDTEEIVSQFQAENKIAIRYLKKENGGKHTAINLGVKEARGELFFIVDSDDHLTDDAVEWIAETAKPIINDAQFAGLSGTRINTNGQRIGGDFPIEKIDCTAIEIRQKHHVAGDLAEIYKTAVLRQHPFPIFAGERFVTEAIVWNRIAADGLRLRYTSKGIYVCEYLKDGLTAHMTRLRMTSPQASMAYYSEYLEMPIPMSEKVKTAINYWRFAFCNDKVSFKSKLLKSKWWSLALLPLGYLFHVKDRHSI